MLIQGDWSSQFKAEETALGNFYVKRDQIRMVKFMNQEGAFNYYTSEELQAHVVELPYQVVYGGKIQNADTKYKILIQNTNANTNTNTDEKVAYINMFRVITSLWSSSSLPSWTTAFRF